MHICLYSGGSRKQNEFLDLNVIEKVGKRGVITYIPSDSTSSEANLYFEDFKEYFRYYGIKRFKYFCHDRKFTNKMINYAFSADGVFLSGGIKYYFMKSIRKQNLFSAINRFLKSEGVLFGQSAGSIILTPSVSTACIGPVKDENLVGLKNLSGLGLVDELFIPHHKNHKKFISEVQNFSSEINNKLIIAAEDGGGLCYNTKQISFVGPLSIFCGGSIIKKFN